MSTRWETYRVGHTVRLRRVETPDRRKPEPTSEPVAVAVAPTVNLSSATKADLVAEAERRGVSTSGTKAEILERLDD